MTKKSQSQKNSEAFTTVYETKDVLVSVLSTSLFEVLSDKLDDTTKKDVYNAVNAAVVIQTDSLVTRLQKILSQ